MFNKDNFKDNILSELNQDKVDYYELSKYILKRCNSKNKYFRNKHKKTIIKLLPKLMEDMSKDIKIYNKSYFILDCLKIFVDINEFKDNFIDSISKINNDNNPKIMDSILLLLKKFDLDKDDIKKVIDNILSINMKLDYATIVELYNLVCNRYYKLTNYMLNTYIINKNTANNIIYLIKDKNLDKNIIYNNINSILDNDTDIDLFRLRDIVINNKDTYSLVKNKIEDNKLYNIDKLVRNLFKAYLNFYKISNEEEKNLNIIIEVIYFIMKDICKNENASISDLIYLDSGSFTNAFSLGDKVIKIGRDRETKTFPNNPYINIMLLRKEFPISKTFSIYVEVSEKVDTKSKISEEELYQLYKKIRNLNLIWLDVAYRNVGRLLKDNIRHWRDNLPITDERLELMPYRGNEVLKKGDLVILDNDMIYDASDATRLGFSTGLQRRFEERYLNELDNSKSSKRR